jgi:hypothetical protein
MPIARMAIVRQTQKDGHAEPSTESDAHRQYTTYQVMETTPCPLSPENRLHVPRSSQFYAPFATCFPSTKVICNLEMHGNYRTVCTDGVGK